MVGPIIFRELMKRGYSIKGNTRVWDIAKRDLLYLNTDLSEAFLNLRKDERYRKNIIDKEVELLRAHSEKILGMLGNDSFNLIDVGCGDGLKAKEFIKSLNCPNKIRFCPISMSRYLTNLALDNVKSSGLNCVNDYKEFLSGFDEVGEVISLLRNSEYQRNVVLILGSLLSSFEINSYLYGLSESMFSGDILVIGNGIRNGDRLVNLEYYKNNIFNNWFIHLMRGLGFKDNEVEYGVRFANGRVQGYYKTNVDKKISYGGSFREFKKGDEIMVAYQYKYYDNELKDFCKMYFRDVEIFKDPEGEYALLICRK